jgi:hypothetical protein
LVCDEAKRQETGVVVGRGGSRMPEIGVSAGAVEPPPALHFSLLTWASSTLSSVHNASS